MKKNNSKKMLKKPVLKGKDDIGMGTNAWPPSPATVNAMHASRSIKPLNEATGGRFGK